MYIILVYDIIMDESGARVQRNVFKICKKYLTHIQNSVFEGEVSDSKLLKLEIEIKKYIRKDQDSVILFKSRNERWLQKEFLGKDESHKTSNFF
ncbi:MAG: CRISPR-associated endonuclease Cas2 [Sebaldella sp.]|nr:CRISPR-associated endonuclease Cas2 [Sebaldella sp.]